MVLFLAIYLHIYTSTYYIHIYMHYILVYYIYMKLLLYKARVSHKQMIVTFEEVPEISY